ncbi:YdcF family protein [Allopontixanthobacter sp.]|uniref:YdcF family protein n=1 Tax=Allopontixanthobacter sp. TaxID=2906452 RepID=UPI002ABA9CB6|nr:YdcF family protein [Allopontixanthobacter sp.]MDZ4308302.1 YdcF family protein [Allopontixanthobacter sp.]
MIRRILAAIVIVWAIGFVWFAVALPRPIAAGGQGPATDAIVVPTGGRGRIERGLEVLAAGHAEQMLVSGVDPEVKPGEFAAQFSVPMQTMDCCITLGYAAVDTRGNATEIADWLAERNYTSVRLVTTDWHMGRAAGELRHVLPDNVQIIEDASPSNPSLKTLLLEYHKLLASRLAWLLPR